MKRVSGHTSPAALTVRETKVRSSIERSGTDAGRSASLFHEMLQDLHDFRLVLNNRDNAHIRAALLTDERIYFVDFRQQTSPCRLDGCLIYRLVLGNRFEEIDFMLHTVCLFPRLRSSLGYILHLGPLKAFQLKKLDNALMT